MLNEIILSLFLSFLAYDVKGGDHCYISARKAPVETCLFDIVSKTKKRLQAIPTT